MMHLHFYNLKQKGRVEKQVLSSKLHSFTPCSECTDSFDFEIKEKLRKGRPFRASSMNNTVNQTQKGMKNISIKVGMLKRDPNTQTLASCIFAVH